MTEVRSIGSLGEAELIARIKQMLPKTASSDVIIGIGDDAAVIRLDNNRLLLATNDAHIEGTHFRRDWATPEQIGRKVMAVNLSDIAAMGGTPTFALVSLGLPPETPADFFDALYRGIIAQANEFNVSIIGGNLTRSDEQLMIDITLLGFVSPLQLLTRAQAKPGDRIFVSGTPGMAAAGLKLFGKYGNQYPKEFQTCIDAFLAPVPQIKLGRALAESGLITSMIDISDGLCADLTHICEASKVGCELIALQLPPNEMLTNAVDILGKPAIDFILNSGESYELLFTVRADVDNETITEIAKQIGVTCTEIGKIIDEQNSRWLVRENGKRETLPKAGWDHFADSQ